MKKEVSAAWSDRLSKYCYELKIFALVKWSENFLIFFDFLICNKKLSKKKSEYNKKQLNK